jgi:hypothetical protein
MGAESSFYAWLLESLPGADYTRAKVREITNDVQNEILAARDGRLMLIKPEPWLVITDSTVKRYVANTSIVSSRDGSTTFDVRRIRRVYSFTDASNPYGSYGGYGSGSQPFPATQKNYMAIPEIDLPVESQDSAKPLAGDCLVDFHRDFSPAVSTELYNVEAWAWPTQLTSEEIAIKIPLQFRKTLLLFGVLAKIETRDFGRDDTIKDKYAQALADWYRYDEVGQADFRPSRTPPREC